MADINELISKEAIAQIEKLERLIDQVAKNMGDVFEATRAANQILGQMKSPTLDEITKKQSEAKESADKLTKSEKELLDAQKALDKQRQAALGQLAKQEAKEREHRETLEKEATTIEELRKKNSALAKERNNVNIKTEEGRKKVAELNKQIDSNNDLIKDNVDALTQQKINIGNYKSAFDGLKQAWLSGEIGLKQLTAGIWKMTMRLMANPVVLLISGITAALAGLYKAFKSTDEGGTLMAARFEQLKSVISVVIQRVASFASGIVDLFSGNWSEAADKMRTAFTGIGEQIRNATAAAKEYIYALDSLEDAEIGYISQRAKNEKRIAELEFMAQNRAISTEARRKALKEAISIAQEQLEKEKDFARSRYEIELNNAAAKYNINVRYLQQFIESDDEAQNILLAGNAQLMKARNNMNDQGQKELEDYYANVIKLETSYFNENKRNISRLSGFEEELRKEKAETLKLREEEAKKVTQIEIDQEKQLDLIAQDAVIKANEYGKKVLEIDEKIAESQLKIQANKREQEKKEEEQHLKDLKEMREQVMGDMTAALMNLSDALFEREISNLEMRRDKGLLTEQQYTAEVAKIKRKQAIAGKAEALFNIAVDTAQAIMEAVAKFPLTGGMPWTAIIAAIGGVQAAAVLAQPIPKFAKGTNYSPEGLAIIGESGRELLQDPSGNLTLSGDSAHLTYLKRGTKIIPNEKTERLLKHQTGSQAISTALIEKQNKAILNKLTNIKQINITPGSNRITERQGHYFREYFNAKLN